MSVQKEKSYPGYQVGTSFLLVIFVTICLVILGVLSLSGALRDRGYSNKTAEKTRMYYTAVSEAQHKLGEIDGLLAEIDRRGISYNEYLDSVEEVFSKQQDISFTKDENQAVLSYEMPITDSQLLYVEISIPDPEKGEGNYKIEKWQEVSDSVWEEEGVLPVLGFDEE